MKRELLLKATLFSFYLFTYALLNVTSTIGLRLVSS